MTLLEECDIENTNANKRQKILDDIILDQPINLDDEIKTSFKPISYDEMTKIEHTNCFACLNITPMSLRENKYHYNLLKLYTDNSTSICKEAIFKLVKTYYDEEIFPITKIEWKIEAVREHFLFHTNFPTDEILRQISITSGVRKHLINNLVEKNEDIESGVKYKFQLNNLKMLISLNKELRILRNLKSELPQMLGYDTTLNY